MQYTLFGNTGMNVSRLCLGTMTFGGKLDLEASGRVLDEALDKGVNFVDTADSYGESEAFLGKLLSPEKRERVYLATKVHNRYCRDGRVARCSRVNILHNVERSLKLMNTDYLDLFMLHHPDPETPVEETLRTLDTLVQQGKLRYWGVSNHYAWQMAYMLGVVRGRELEPMVSVQSSYSILERQIEREMVPMLQRFNIALMCYSPLCGGILTGKYHPENGQPESGRADKGVFKARVEDEIVSSIVHELRSIAKDQNLTMNQLAIAWLLSKPWSTTVLLGGTKPEHFTSIYDVADTTLPSEVIERIDEISRPRMFAEYFNQPFKAGARLDVNG